MCHSLCTVWFTLAGAITEIVYANWVFSFENSQFAYTIAIIAHENVLYPEGLTSLEPMNIRHLEVPPTSRLWCIENS